MRCEIHTQSYLHNSQHLLGYIEKLRFHILHRTVWVGTRCQLRYLKVQMKPEYMIYALLVLPKPKIENRIFYGKNLILKSIIKNMNNPTWHSVGHLVGCKVNATSLLLGNQSLE